MRSRMAVSGSSRTFPYRRSIFSMQTGHVPQVIDVEALGPRLARRQRPLLEECVHALEVVAEHAEVGIPLPERQQLLRRLPHPARVRALPTPEPLGGEERHAVADIVRARSASAAPPGRLVVTHQHGHHVDLTARRAARISGTGPLPARPAPCLLVALAWRRASPPPGSRWTLPPARGPRRTAPAPSPPSRTSRSCRATAHGAPPKARTISTRSVRTNGSPPSMETRNVPTLASSSDSLRKSSGGELLARVRAVGPEVAEGARGMLQRLVTWTST